MADAPERIGRFDYGNGEIIYAEPGMIIRGQTNYIRADLVDELVKALEEARERVEHWADVASRADRTRYDTSDDLAKIDAALTRIKGDVT